MRKAHPIIRFLGSLNLAVSILIFLAILLAVATWIEGQYGTQNVNLWVYKTGWFDSVLILLFINIFFATYLRYPFKRHHFGFVLTHGGILLLLVGAYITRQVGQEGMLSFFEKETSNAIVQDGTILQFLSDKQVLFRIDTDYYETKSLEPVFDLGSSGYKIKLKQVSAHSESGFQYIDIKDKSIGLKEIPAIKFSLNGSMGNITDQWLSLNNPYTQTPDTIDLGMAKIKLIKAKKAELSKYFLAKEAKKGNLNIFTQDGNLLTSLDIDKLEAEKEVTLTDGSKLKFLDFYPFATVSQNMLINDPSERFINPAVRVEVEFPDKTTDTILRFQNIPEFKSSRETNTSLIFSLTDSEPISTKPYLDIIVSDNNLFYKSFAKSGLSTGVITVNKPFNTGWMDFSVTVEQFIQNSKPEQTIKMLPRQAGMKSLRPAVRFELFKENQKENIEEFILQYGDDLPLTYTDIPITIVYGPRLLYLPFSVTLDEFRKVDYPGTMRAMSYESDVSINDPDHSPSVFQQTIKMNHILEHRNWKFYQSDFEILDDGRKISRLQVSYDPGTTLIYIGCLVMMLGICIMFWIEPMTRRRKKVEETCKE